MSNKIIRTICYFTQSPSNEIVEKLNQLEKTLADNGFVIQTKRICSPNVAIKEMDMLGDESLYKSIGTLEYKQAMEKLDDFLSAKNVAFNINLTEAEISEEHTKMLFEIIKRNASKTFSFTYVFNNSPSSPYFPSASYEKEGFAIGLQPTDLAEDCNSLEEWLNKLKDAWNEINNLFGLEIDYLGIDSSIAPLFEGKSSLINFIKRIQSSFEESVITDTYLTITKFIKENNPKPIGLCGLMFPCLEDFELADEYEKGNFSIERNIFLSLHSGLGIDTYPIGIDESPEKVVNIWKTIQGLSNKYKKPLSVRFVSDGKAKIGEKTDFQNQYLKDVTIRNL